MPTPRDYANQVTIDSLPQQMMDAINTYRAELRATEADNSALYWFIKCVLSREMTIQDMLDEAGRLESAGPRLMGQNLLEEARQRGVQECINIVMDLNPGPPTNLERVLRGLMVTRK